MCVSDTKKDTLRMYQEYREFLKESCKSVFLKVIWEGALADGIIIFKDEMEEIWEFHKDDIVGATCGLWTEVCYLEGFDLDKGEILDIKERV